jgi:hypothetical protein
MSDPGRRRYFIIKAEKEKKEMEEVVKKMIQESTKGNGKSSGNKNGGK